MPTGVFPRSKEHSAKIGLSRLGSKNPMWRGDKVCYTALHAWVKRHRPRPEACEGCKEPKPLLDLANISGDYLRDLSDWEYLCRKCHMIKDGRLKRFLAISPSKMTRHEIICIVCKKKVLQSHKGAIYCSETCHRNRGRGIGHG